MIGEAVSSPYVGPRPFERQESDRFFGREQEANELLSLIIANRAVVFYAPSGAGKTSLLNAKVAPLLHKEGFDVYPSTRVQGPISEDVTLDQIPNIYIFNALMTWAGDEADEQALVDLTLAEFLASRPHDEDEYGSRRPRVIIFDQFEELFTVYPQRWRDREGFFNQVCNALEADSLLRVVFSMREDYVAQLDPYAILMPRNLRTRFRLERMRPAAALLAVSGPLQVTERAFAPGVAEQLVEDLRRVRAESALGETTTVVGEFVEPVQLQVVCQNLWRDLPADVMTITQEHLQVYGDVGQALTQFYERAVQRTTQATAVRERLLRDWFVTQLITPAGTRGTVYRGTEETGGITNEAIQVLENAHLIRGEWRAGARWYELTHDTLIEPIQHSNRHWHERRRRRALTTAVTVGILFYLAILAFIALYSDPGGGDAAELQEQLTQAEVTIAANSGTATAELQTRSVVDNVTATAVANERATSTTEAQQRQDEVATATEEFYVRSTEEAIAAVTATANALVTQQAIDATSTSSAELAMTATAAADIAATAQALVERGRVRPLYPGVSIGGADSRAAGTLGAFVRDDRGNVYLLSHIEILGSPRYMAQTAVLQPSPIDGGRITNPDNEAETDIVADYVLTPTLSPSDPFPISSLVALARLDADIDYLVSHPDTGAMAGVDTPVLGERVRLIGRTSGLVNGRISGISISAPLSFDFASNTQQQTTFAGAFAVESSLVDRAGNPFPMFAPGDEGGLIMDSDNNILGIVVAGSENLALVAPIQDVLANLGDGFTLLYRGQEIRSFGGYEGFVVATALSPDGTLLASGDAFGFVYIQSLVNPNVPPTIINAHSDVVRSLEFSPDGKILASASWDRNIRLWDVTTPGAPLISFFNSITGGLIWSIDFSPNGRLLISGHEDGRIRIWNLNRVNNVPTLLEGHTANVLSVAYSPDGKMLTSGSGDGTVRLWDATDLSERPIVLTDHKAPVWAVAFSPDGQTLASASADQSVVVRNIADLDAVSVVDTFELPNVASDVAFSPDGTLLAAASYDGNIYYWELSSGAAYTLTGHSDRVNDVVFSGDGRFLVSASGDLTVRLWQMR